MCVCVCDLVFARTVVDHVDVTFTVSSVDQMDTLLEEN